MEWSSIWRRGTLSELSEASRGCVQVHFFIGRPGEYKLKKGLADAHDNDPTGILWVGPAGAAVAAEHGFPILEPGAYGHRLSDVAQSNLVATLTPTLTPRELGQRADDKSIFKVFKKRMDQVPGSRQPCLCAFTDHKSRRSDERRSARSAKWKKTQWNERPKGKGKSEWMA